MSRHFVFIFSTVLLPLICFSQRGWNIKYIYSNEINAHLVGETVRLDFRHGKEAVERTNWIKSILSTQDTGWVMTEFSQIKFIEKRELYDDQGLFDEQTLISQNFENGNGIIIYDSEILEVWGQSIKLKLFTDKRNSGSFLIGLVDIKQLDGLLMEIKE